MILILGIIIGLLIAVIIMLSVKRFQNRIERTLKQIENVVKEKGEIYTPNEDTENISKFLENLPNE